jgi:hypothetical protein
MRKPFLIALALIAGVITGSFLSSVHADSDYDIVKAIERQDHITVAGMDLNTCHQPCPQPFTTVGNEYVNTSTLYTSQLIIAGRRGVDVQVQIGDQLVLAPLSDPPTQEEINAQFRQIRQFLIDRGLAIETTPNPGSPASPKDERSGKR